MTLPLRTLTIAERWDCHACGDCCRGAIVRLDDDDLERLREQGWEKHPDYRGVRIIDRHGWFKRYYQLAHRSDGNCVFLTSDNRCRIHQEYGEAAKPLICRMAPFQLVPLESFAYVTLRRYCPCAAADDGRQLQEHLHTVRKLAERRKMAQRPPRPPRVTRKHRRSWHDTLRAAEVIERLMLDARYPPVRRLVHGLQFCNLLQECRLRKLDGERFEQLLSMLESSAADGPERLFDNRRPPGRAAGMLFRQIALEYVRLHPKFVIERSWRERWRLIRSALAFARGKGRVPRIHSAFPETTFEALERPLGHLNEGVLRPLCRYFEAMAASKQYAVWGREGWSIIESFRALAASYSIALWLLRFACGDRPPQFEDTIDVVRALDRGQSYAPLCGI